MKILAGFNRFMLAHATGRNICLLLAITIVSFWLMAAIIAPAFQGATDGLRPFDLNFGISSEVIYRDLPTYTDRSRTLYLWFALVDYIYPAAAAAFFAMLWAWLFNKAPNRGYEKLVRGGVLCIPFLFALVDWLENAGFLFVIFSYPAEHTTIASLAGKLKGVKPLIELVTALLTLVFVIVTIRLVRLRRHYLHDRQLPESVTGSRR